MRGKAERERIERMRALAAQIHGIADRYDTLCRRAWVELTEYPTLEGRPLPGYDELTAALARVDALYDIAVRGPDEIPGRWFHHSAVVEAAVSWEARTRAILEERAE